MISRTLGLAFLIIFGLSRVAVSQENDCADYNYDSGVCCDNQGPSCDAEQGPGNGGGGDSSSCASSSWVVSYTDIQVDSSGNMYAWTMTSNSQSSAATNSISSFIGVSPPDGSAYLNAYQQSSSSSTVEASVSSYFSSFTDNNDGELDGLSDVEWTCGGQSFLSFSVNISFPLVNYRYIGSTPQGTCAYQVTCPYGFNSFCGSRYPNVQVPNSSSNPCQSYLEDIYLRNDDKCFPIGLGHMQATPGSCT